MAQTGSAPRSHRGGQGFKSPQLHTDKALTGKNASQGLSLCLCDGESSPGSPLQTCGRDRVPGASGLPGQCGRRQYWG